MYECCTYVLCILYIYNYVNKFEARTLLSTSHLNDLVLISKTKHGLQLGINALYEFCSASTLTVNTNKSEVMYVSKRKPASLLVIYYNNISLRWVDSFRNLGVNIYRTNNLSKEVKLTCHQAKKAQSTLDMHTSSHSTVFLNHIFKLFDCLIKPVSTYGCAVWGSGNIAEIEKC